ncbi:unnamed protein product [Protopolystoma xenopodis]|uniref:DNA mismatch repair protein S5 domain-containing protein n=1 Tax=Protopolystoma xenopodis TaxID=117903 RepID=A0A448WRP4_9PLAT|nr:unnamed protein product [Protopolystoma xenopodis]
MAYTACLPHCTGKIRSSRSMINSTGGDPALASASLLVYLGLQLPAAILDVNVHPTKSEVHFMHEVGDFRLIEFL